MRVYKVEFREYIFKEDLNDRYVIEYYEYLENITKIDKKIIQSTKINGAYHVNYDIALGRLSINNSIFGKAETCYINTDFKFHVQCEHSFDKMNNIIYSKLQYLLRQEKLDKLLK